MHRDPDAGDRPRGARARARALGGRGCGGRGGARCDGRARAAARRRAVSEVVFVGPPRRALAGTVAVPGDKSIAHRALLLGALAEGVTRVEGFPGGADTRSTLAAVRTLGARADQAGDVVLVEGGGPDLGVGASVAVGRATS